MIEGMKLSNELVLVNTEISGGSGPRRFHLYEKLTEERINIRFLSRASAGKQVRTSFCVGVEDGNRLEALILSEPDLGRGAEFVHSVGALSLFPHHFSLKILGLAVHAFGGERLPFYAMASSISSLTFITDYDILDRAASVMEKYLDFPPHHTPYKPVTRGRRIF